MKTKIIKQWDGWRLDFEHDVYFLCRDDDVVWFRPLKAKTDTAAIIEAEAIIASGDRRPIDWELQDRFHSKKECFRQAIDIARGLRENGYPDTTLREAVGLAAKLNWMF